MITLSPSGLPYLSREELEAIYSPEEFEWLAKARIRPETYQYISGFAGTGEGHRMNRDAFGRWVFCSRILRDVSSIDLSTVILGRQLRTPILLGASAMHRLSHPSGELATARAATMAGTVMMLSTSSSVRLEELSPLAENRWLQLYWMNDRAFTLDLVQRAEAHNYQAIALTVDYSALGWREAEKRLGDWDTGDVVQANFPTPVPDGLALDSTITWRSLDWLRSVTSMPIILKGILSVADAKIAVEEEIPAIIVSTHGGRQLDYLMASLDALPPIVDAVAGRMEIYLDSGVRRGTDVLKALALGANAAIIGRPVHWALGAGGEAGLLRLLAIMNGELMSAMALCGATSISAVDRSIVAPRPR